LGDIVFGKIDENFTNYTGNQLKVSIKKISKILGFTVDEKDVVKALKSLGMKVVVKGDSIDISAPTYRMDIKEDVDVIEDIARIIGYDKIPASVPHGNLIPPEKNVVLENEMLVKNILKGLGLSEVFTYTFVGEELIKSFDDNASAYLELKNPLSPDQAYLRKNLIYSLSQCAIENSKNFDKLSIFEISKVFSGDDKHVEESKKIGIALLDGNSFFDVKGIIESLFDYLNIKDYSFEESSDKYFYMHPRKLSSVFVKGKKVGFLGELHPRVLSRMDVKKTVTVSQLDFDELIESKAERIYKPYSKFPGVLIDMAIVIDERVPEKKVREAIKMASGELFDSIELFDVYRGSQIKAGEKSLAYHLTFRSKEKTLTEEEVTPYQKKIVAALKKDFGAILRS